MAGIFGSIIGSTVGGIISGAINAATGGSQGSSGSSSGSSSQPNYGGSNSSQYGNYQNNPFYGTSGNLGTGGPGYGIGTPGDVNYNPTVDYSALMEAAASRGDYVTAAVWEAYRNAKIQGENLSGQYAYTNKYQQYLPQEALWWNPSWGGSSSSGGGGWGGGYESGGYMPQDQSKYLEELYKAQLEAQKAALKDAYEKNLSALNAEQSKLSGNYQAARNDTAAQSALSQQRFNETAAAYGLNSGTAGQAALSYATQLQSDLGTLQAAESAANAEIQRQRTLLSQEYQNALVQAQADNDYERFQALYEEAVRVDEALQNQSQFNASQALKQYQTMLDQYYQEREWGLTQEQWQYEQQQNQYKQKLEAAETLMEQGDYSAYGQLMGWDQSKIDQMEAAWKAANTKKTISNSSGSSGSSSRYSGGSSSGSSSSGSSSSSSGDPVLDAYRAGCRTYSAAVAYFKRQGYGDGISRDMAQDLERRIAKGEVGVNEQKVRQLYNNIIEIRDTSLNKSDPNFARKAIEEYRKQTSLKLNDDEVAWLLKQFGYAS